SLHYFWVCGFTGILSALPKDQYLTDLVSVTCTPLLPSCWFHFSISLAASLLKLLWASLTKTTLYPSANAPKQVAFTQPWVTKPVATTELTFLLLNSS